MKVTAKEMREVSVLKDVVCDVCGNTCRDKYGINYEFATFTATWGYGSDKDAEMWEAHICERCCDTLPFVTKIRKREYLFGAGKSIGIGDWRAG